MSKLILALVLTISQAFAGDAVLFYGNYVRALKQSIIFKGSEVAILTGDADDPTSVAKNAVAGSLYIRDNTTQLYIKADDGSSTNWTLIPSGLISLSSGVTGVLDEVNGGTGISTYTTGDFLYASGSNTLAKRAAGVNGYVLEMVAGVPNWAAKTGAQSVGTIDSVTKVANGLALSGTALIMQTADATHPGLVSNGSQDLGSGTKNIETLTLTNPLSGTYGGLGANLSWTAGNIPYGSGSAAAMLSAGTAGRPLLSGATPAYFTGTGFVTAASGVLAADFGTANQLVGMNAAGNAKEYKTLSGTANQVTVTPTVGGFTLSTPQDGHTGASPDYSGLDLLAQGELRLQDTSGGQYSGFRANGTTTSSGVYTLPATDGSSGQLLRTDGSLGLSWVTGAQSSDTIKSPNITDPIVVSAFVTDGSATTTVSEDTSNFVNGNCANGSTGNYTCPIQGFSSTPHCWLQAFGSYGIWTITAKTTSSITIQVRNEAGSLQDTDFMIFCKTQ